MHKCIFITNNKKTYKHKIKDQNHLFKLLINISTRHSKNEIANFENAKCSFDRNHYRGRLKHRD